MPLSIKHCVQNVSEKQAQNCKISTDRHRHWTQTVTDIHRRRQTDAKNEQTQTDADRSQVLILQH